MLREINPQRTATGYLYDGMQRLVQVTEDQGSIPNGHLNLHTNYSYDPSGDRLSQTDGNSQTTTYTVDDLGRTTKVTDASSKVEQTNYSLAGEVVSTINARNKTNTNTLDTAMRLTGVAYFNSSGGNLYRTFAYDADGNQTCFTSSTGAGACGTSDANRTTIAYDHLNRVSTVTAPSPYGTTTYSYFLDGATNTIVDANGTTTFTEDHLGRTSGMSDPISAGTVCSAPTGATTCYTYDAAGRLTGRTEANGIVTTVGYTPIDQLASKTEVGGSTTLVSWASITYDLAQNRTGENLAYYSGNPFPDPQAGTATYQYDSLNQLSQANLPGKTAANYGFDPAHNLTSNAGTTQTFNANESLQTACSVTLGSDDDGNLAKDCAGTTLAWNSLSQLDAYGSSETYTYDPIGRLLTVTNGANVTKFVYQGISDQVIQELNSSNAAIRSYAWDASGRQLYAKAGSNVWYEITDPHGDVVALASASALAGTKHFDAWGNLLNSGGATIPFGFQGGYGSWTDATTGLVIMGARWYYAMISFFTSSDPAAGTANPRTPTHRARWIFGANNPLNTVDPSGLALANSGGGADVPIGSGAGIVAALSAIVQTIVTLVIKAASSAPKPHTSNPAPKPSSSGPAPSLSTTLGECRGAGFSVAACNSLVQEATAGQAASVAGTNQNMAATSVDNGEITPQLISECAGAVPLGVSIVAQGRQLTSDEVSSLASEMNGIAACEGGVSNIVFLQLERAHNSQQDLIAWLSLLTLGVTIKPSRLDATYKTFDEALQNAKDNAGDLGSDSQAMYDPQSGVLIGAQSANGKQGWRIDQGHVNWWDWSQGKKGRGGRYGHSSFPEDQMSSYSKYKGYAPWQSDLEK